MGYQYIRDDLFRFTEYGIKAAVDTFYGQLLDASDKSASAFADDAWQGQAADRFKGYYDDMYGSILTLFDSLSRAIKNKCTLYLNDYKNLDSDEHAKIYTSELDDFKDWLKNNYTDAETVNTNVSNKIDDIDDITGGIAFDEPDISGELETMKSNIETLVASISSLESSFQTDFAEIDDLILQITTLINDAKSVVVGSDGKSLAYDRSAYQQHFSDAALAYANQANYEKDHAKDLDAAEQALLEEVEVRQKEYEERQRAAFGLQVVIAVAAVAVTVATAGAAGPVVAVAIGAGVGAVSGAANSIATQSVGDLAGGGLSRVDPKEVGKEFVIGGITGAVTSCLGMGSAKAIAATANSAHPVAAKVMIKTGEKVLSGIATRGIGTTIREGDLEKGLADAFDGKQIAGDAAGAATGELIGAGMDSIYKKTGLDKLAEGDKVKNKIADYGEEILKDQAKDAGKRASKALVTTEGGLEERLKAAGKDAVNPEEMIKTGLETVVGKGTEDLVSHRQEVVDQKEEDGKLNGFEKWAKAQKDKAIDKKANDPKFQEQTRQSAEKEAREKYGEKYDQNVKEGKEYKISKDAYVNQHSAKETGKNTTKEKMHDAAETSVNKSVQATYKGAVKNTADAAIDRIQGDTPDLNEGKDGLAKDEWVNKFQQNP